MTAPAPEKTRGAAPPGVARGLARAAAAVIGWYQRGLSPLLPRRCRFWPTCSEYARLAILRHGILRGGALGVRRLLRCHPFGSGGVDRPP